MAASTNKDPNSPKFVKNKYLDPDLFQSTHIR